MTTRDDERMRAGDGDRHQAVEMLRSALDEGRLTLAEYDERVATAYRAVTYADLNTLLEDLPRSAAGAVVPVPARAATLGPPPARRMPVALQILWTIWASVVAVNVAVWLIVCVTAGWVYPWPLWVAGPTGAALLGATIGVDWIRTHRDAG